RSSESPQIDGLGGGEGSGGAARGAFVEQLSVSDVALTKAALAVREVPLPESQELFPIAQCGDFRAAGQEALAPVPQGQRIVARDVFETNQLQVGPSARLRERAQGGNAAAGEDVALDEVDVALVGLEAPVPHGDGLNQHQARRSQQALAHSEEFREVLM